MGKLHTYEGRDITVTWESGLCIHAGECVMRLRQVFDTRVRPWVRPDEADAQTVAEIIHLCPTGALKYSRKDNGATEIPDPVNGVMIRPHGPLYLRGDLSLKIKDSEQRETRVALCRCGHSRNKPFCDNSHFDAKFRDRGQLGEEEQVSARVELDGKLEIEFETDGPIHLSGPHDIISADRAVTTRMASALCRCGNSKNKPFCDGSHEQDFRSE